jgi:hypothetical protein
VSDYELSSGLPLDGATGTITKCEFGFNAQIGVGVVCANMTISVEGGEDIEQSFSVGDGWEIGDKGAKLVSDKATQRLNNRSNYGRLVQSMLNVIGGPEHMVANFPKGYKDASNLIGSTWTWGTTEVETTNPSTKEKKIKNAVVVTSFVGVDSEVKASAPAASTKGAAKGKAAKPGLADKDPELFASLVELAGEHESHEDFVEAAMALDTVEGSADAMNAVMSTKPGSVWAARNAS